MKTSSWLMTLMIVTTLAIVFGVWSGGTNVQKRYDVLMADFKTQTGWLTVQEGLTEGWKRDYHALNERSEVDARIAHSAILEMNDNIVILEGELRQAEWRYQQTHGILRQVLNDLADTDAELQFQSTRADRNMDHMFDMELMIDWLQEDATKKQIKAWLSGDWNGWLDRLEVLEANRFYGDDVDGARDEN